MYKPRRFLSQIPSSTWSLEMDQVALKAPIDRLIEIIPPKPIKRDERSTVTCLCCLRQFPASRMDADGCGICEECLAP